MSPRPQGGTSPPRSDGGGASSRRSGATGRTLFIWASGILGAALLAVAAMATLGAPETSARQLGQQAVPADLALRDVALADQNSQGTFIAGLEAADPAVRGTSISDAQAFGQAADAAWASYKNHELDRPGEAALQQAYETSAVLGRRLGADLVVTSHTSPTYASTFTAEVNASNAENAALSKLETTIYAPLVRGAGPSIGTDISRARSVIVGSIGLFALLFSIVVFTLMRGARRDQQALADEAAVLRTARKHAEFDASLQSALEMATSEDETIDVVRQALQMIAPSTPAELLIADSSHAHFRQVLTTDDSTECGCQVGSPTDCPAAIGGHTRVFADSSRLDTCRFLRGRGDKVWAVCVPVNVAGRTTGVIHAQHGLDDELRSGLPTGLEVIARKTGDRVGALRVLARTEAQAQTDPLTGLPNRRTLDGKLHDLVIDNTPYVVAFADLDHFKVINDTYGHETGDRALRLFARVLRDSVRPRDLVARHGGEEFLIVLPECSVSDARAVGDRLRHELAKVLDQAAVPAFTVTVGLAASEPGDAFSEVVARADATMLRAKSLGRDRVLATSDAAASTVVDEPPATAPLSAVAGGRA